MRKLMYTICANIVISAVYQVTTSKKRFTWELFDAAPYSFSKSSLKTSHGLTSKYV